MLLFALVLGTNTPCPAYPPLAPTKDVLADPGVRAALSKVQETLQAAAAALPSGLVATIVLNQTTMWSGGFGHRSPKSHEPPRSSDLVRIASITKVFTDLLVYKMRDAESVSLDDPLAKHLRGFEMRGALGSRTRGTITLRNLASHTSGLPRETPYPCSLGGQHCTEADVLALLKDIYPVLAPYRRFHYSNLGIALLGRALAHAHRAPTPVSYALATSLDATCRCPSLPCIRAPPSQPHLP